MVDIIFVSHSRTMMNKDSSKVWTEIKKGVKEESSLCNFTLETFSPIIHYFDIAEYMEFLRIAVEKNPHYLIFSGLVDSSEIIKNFKGGCVIVNTEPDWSVPVPYNYVGMDDRLAGKMAGEKLTSQKTILPLLFY